MSERVTYTKVKWRLKRMHDKLLIVAIEGADKSIKELNASDGSPFMVDLEIRKMQASDLAQSVGLRIDVDKNLVGFLASDQEEKREQIMDKGLSVAMQRARHGDIKCLQTVPEFLDDTLIALRNNLVHLPSQDKLSQPIPTPDKNQLQTIEELRSNSELVRHLLYYVVNIINTVFVDRLQLEGV